ncbi:hypothetical protein DCCM_1034 [Desulfocucumis palustris]|uniref:MobA-like NTP transferase domain-containing protein n=1 Tax=Desulfocucumis palustris TaxID=1898651 RepID=A0A2L2X9M1_9FIRM|nr:nucleotidyltransferase family protein [Desulfocucumis palustris]GBF32838.1 hypothetical protein DCCM_1034 [Desulfocucumis palustris]
MVDAIVLAGSPNTGPLKECSPARYEALISIGGKTMVEYVVEALNSSKKINNIVVVGPRDELAEIMPGYVTVVPAGNSLLENLMEGLRHLSGTEKVLMATCDIPMITPQAIENFLDLCSGKQADIYYPVISKKDVERIYPCTSRTYVSLKEGRFTGGNLFLFKPEVVEGCMKKGQQLVAARKSPVKMCKLLGTVFLIKFLLRQVSLREAESRVSTVLGVSGAVVISSYPEVGVDVDKPSDLQLATEKLSMAV